MDKQYNPDGFSPKHGGYEKLITYKKSEIIDDGTYFFTRKYFKPFDRTIDQMVQAARSGKQNIIDGSMASQCDDWINQSYFPFTFKTDSETGKGIS